MNRKNVNAKKLLKDSPDQGRDIISNIRFPKAKDLLEKMKLEFHPCDITCEDLNNEDVRKELMEKN